VERYDVRDSSVVQQGEIKFMMNNTLTFGDVKAVRVQDLMVREIIQSNNWERPIYFAATCSDDSKIGLQDYLRMEGMAFRFVPEKRQPGIEFINPDLMKAQLQENPDYSTDFEPGFKFRGVNNPDIFFDENHRRLIQNYRNSFIRLALYYINTNQNNLAIQTLDQMDEIIPREIRPMPFGLMYELSNLYYSAGARDKYTEIAGEVEQLALASIEQNPQDIQSYYNPYRILIDIYENTNDFENAYKLWQRIEVIYPNDPSVKANVEKYRKLVQKDDVLRDTNIVN
jgi:tetratricopeptide (TPR) repeat protein